MYCIRCAGARRHMEKVLGIGKKRGLKFPNMDQCLQTGL